MLTILRKEEYRALSSVFLTGDVLDLGGGVKGQYQNLCQGTYRVTSANIDPETKPNIICDLEKPLPFRDVQYDGILLVNVLEHIFEYRQLLCECARVLAPSGTVVIVVPFLFPYHSSPNDFHRYTKDALERALAEAGFSDILVRPLGSGLCAACWSMIERLLPRPFRILSFCLVPLTRVVDTLLAYIARSMGKKYKAADYALGFITTAVKK